MPAAKGAQVFCQGGALTHRINAVFRNGLFIKGGYITSRQHKIVRTRLKGAAHANKSVVIQSQSGVTQPLGRLRVGGDDDCVTANFTPRAAKDTLRRHPNNLVTGTNRYSLLVHRPSETTANRVRMLREYVRLVGHHGNGQRASRPRVTARDTMAKT